MGKRSRKERTKKRRAGSTPAPAAVPAESGTVATAAPLAEQVIAAVVEQIFAAVDEPSTPSAAPVEHRHFPRVALEVEVDLASESNFFSGLSGDLSEGGLYVSTYRAVQIGSPVDVAFTLPNGKVQAHGVVRWHRDATEPSPPGVGIVFEALSDEQKELIHAFCAHRPPIYYEVDSVAE